jgi:hypothetical protein
MNGAPPEGVIVVDGGLVNGALPEGVIVVDGAQRTERLQMAQSNLMGPCEWSTTRRHDNG